MEEDGIKFEAAPRKNMNRLMSLFECYHIKHRSIIESNWGTLKNNFQLEYHKARSIVGMFRTYLIFPLFPAPFPAFYSYPSIWTLFVPAEKNCHCARFWFSLPFSTIQNSIQKRYPPAGCRFLCCGKSIQFLLCLCRLQRVRRFLKNGKKCNYPWGWRLLRQVRCNYRERM